MILAITVDERIVSLVPDLYMFMLYIGLWYYDGNRDQEINKTL